MKIEEFYLAIKHVDDPDTYEEALPQVHNIAYGVSQEKTLTSATRYYLKQFEKHGHKKWFVSVNMAAWWFVPDWFFYRRMYMHGVAYIFMPFFLNVLFLWLIYSLLSDFLSLWNLKVIGVVVQGVFWAVLRLYLGLVANSLYFQNVQRRFQKELRSNSSWSSWLCGGILMSAFLVSVYGLSLKLV